MDIKTSIKNQRQYFNQGHTKEILFRINQLKTLEQAIIKNEERILSALKKDLNKAIYESYLTEVGLILSEIRFTIKNVRAWSRPQKVKTPLIYPLASSYNYPEPYGIVLIISPWNYPFQLTMAPLIGAMAAGNCAVLKPSEYSSHTSGIIFEILADNFENQYIAAITGDAETGKALLEQKFDYIFFTGSVPLGKIVMAAASKHLTPVTLELGGKSPCIVDRETNINLSAKRIVSGKFINAGQTCIAPDYLMIHRSVKAELVNRMQKFITQFYGERPHESKDYPRIISNQHFERVAAYLDRGNIIVGGETDQKQLYISPTLLDNIGWDDPIMQDEIFGPILPILEYQDLSQVIAAVNARPKPLALYFFSTNKQNQQRILEEISFGGGCLNDTLLHFATPYLSFGGVGNSGMGKYHGKASFDTFSHRKSIFKNRLSFDLPLRYPPYKNLKYLKKILR
ncbi:MAG: aldehyde dehydrogenase [Planctomycetota bacterium]|jgi:aldehyde dehydrogenase (NAD+)